MKNFLKKQLAWLTDQALCLSVSFLTGVRPKSPRELAFNPQQKVYYANHGSHGDFLLVWISLPAPLAAFDASRCRLGLLADQQTQTLHHPKRLQRALDTAPQRQSAVDYRTDEPRAPSGRFADYLP